MEEVNQHKYNMDSVAIRETAQIHLYQHTMQDDPETSPASGA